ncbi:MAG: hypothetical protein WEB37_00100 [Bacteroidota bacterium]
MTILSLFCSLLIFVVSFAASQVPSTSINPSDWGISNASDIRLAQFSLVQTSKGPLFNVQSVYPTGFFSDTSLALLENGCMTLADFDDPFINRLGGSYHGFQSGSSTAALVHDLSGTTGAQTLRLVYSKKPGEYCGFWMHTFNSAAPANERNYLDATRFPYLLVTLKGTTGREQLLLKAADEVWNAKEDALPVGEIGSFLPKGRIDTTWQTAIIPISAFPKQLITSRLATLVFEVTGSDSGTIEFSSFSFCSVPMQPQPASMSESARQPENAIWVWNTRDLVRDQRALEGLLSFLRDQSINHVFLAIPYDSDHPEARKGVPINHDEMARVVRSLNASGVKVHALAGDKDFVKPEHRPFVRTTMQNIIRYQQTIGSAAQFYGIHLDIEPYLLPGFSSARQSWHLQNLLEVFAECASLARSARMVIGADIPAWLDAPNELTHRQMEILWNGGSKPVYQHIMDLMDFVALMDYRTRAWGEGGFISQAANELRYAAEIRKNIFVGLETVPLPDEKLFVIRGEPKRGMPDTRKNIVCALRRDRDVLIALFENGTPAMVGALLKDNNRSVADLFWWPVIKETNVPASSLTFAQDEGASKLKSAIQEAGPFLQNFRSFAGFSFHDYKNYRALLAK